MTDLIGKPSISLPRSPLSISPQPSQPGYFKNRLNNAVPPADTVQPSVPNTSWKIMICLLGNFRVVKKNGSSAILGAKADSFLCCLALHPYKAIPRDSILESLWPDHPPILAGQSLNSLVYSLHRAFSDVLQGNSPISCQDGYYYLNKDAGVAIDTEVFDKFVQTGNQLLLNQNWPEAASIYQQAIDLYSGDLCGDVDKEDIAEVERERLRAHYLTVLSRLADYFFTNHNYDFCLRYTERLLQTDPCREDAHRLVMRCYVRQGERAQALRQYRLCERLLRAEYDACPELQTTILYDQVRLNPESI